MDIVLWKKLPDDVIEMIVPHLSVRDRIRLSSVCKLWSSVPMRTDILVLNISFPGKVGKLDLPEPVQGGWFQGSSKGWMIMIKEKDLDSTMFLVNPISGAQHQLPPLSTTPSFQSFVDTTAWKRYGASAFWYSVVLSTSDINSDQFMVAATFGDTLCLCRLGDTRWRFIEVLDENEGITDLLFSSGKLYALLVSDNKIGVISAPRTLKCGNHVLELQLVYDKKPRTNDSMEEYADYLVQLQGTVENVEGSDDDDDDNEDDNLEGNEEGGEEVDDMGFGICTIDEDNHDLKL
ncbi:uncharacterized protein LOC133711907 [Rosa rugosa]|uniref:uncharacterized protein LOC133711907 n=1 Tax=Rosa rugosa TaxID=74645 RepID=UPI002B40717F|nr:uncharacterized protein LOC133711907 [Rosa rugosa]